MIICSKCGYNQITSSDQKCPCCLEDSDTFKTIDDNESGKAPKKTKNLILALVCAPFVILGFCFAPAGLGLAIPFGILLIVNIMLYNKK